MRNAANHIDPLVEGADQIGGGRLMPQIAVLRKGHQLQVEIRRHFSADLQQGIHSQQAIITDIDMAADRQGATRNRPMAELARSPLDHLDRQVRLQFAPELDALQQSATLVEPRLAEAQGRIHVKMTVDKRRCHQATTRIDLATGFGSDGRFNGRNAPILDTDIDASTAIRQSGTTQQQIEHQRSSFRKGISKLAGALALRDTSAMARMVITKGSMRKIS